VKPTFQLFTEYVTLQPAVVVVGSVVKVTADETADALPATSRARTTYEYAVAAVRPVSAYVAAVGEPTRVCVEPWTRYTSYPATPEPASVDAVQVSVAPVWVTADAAGVPGTDGAVVSGGISTVVNDTDGDDADTLPATSLARTAYVYAVAGVRPVRVYVALVVDPTSTGVSAPVNR
jgi:hypothetical protein